MPPAQPLGNIPPADFRLPATAAEQYAQRSLSAYVHIPFCRVRCGYCDFNTYTRAELGSGASIGDYLQSLTAEMRLAAQLLQEQGLTPKPLSTVFFGGGTPTMLPAQDLVQAITTLKAEFGLAPGCEITVEANPDTVTEELVATLATAGVSRFSLGVQSTQNHVLQVLERTHNPANVAKAVTLIRQAGLQLSLDLIYGTPSETVADYERTLAEVVKWAPDHISAYALIIEEGTKLAAQMRRGVYPYPDPDDQADKYELTEAMLSAAGMHWYELSNWATGPDYYCRHNLNYWLNQNWWGFGPGAHSHLGGLRFWNRKHPRSYAAQVQQHRAPVAGWETPDTAAQLLETILLRTRVQAGMPLDVFPVEARARAREIAASLAQRGLVEKTALAQDRIVLTLKGRLLADEVVRQLTD